MSKKSFKNGFDLILGEKSIDTDIQKKIIDSDSYNMDNGPKLENQRKTQQKRYQKITLRIDETYFNKIKTFAYLERITMTAAINQALEKYLEENKEKLPPQ